MDNKIKRLQNHLSLIRTCAGWSAAELGEKLGVSRQMISNLENRHNAMTMMQYRAIRNVLTDEFDNSPNDTQMLRDVLRVLVDEPELFSDEQRNQVLSDAKLLSPSILAKKTTRSTATTAWIALAGAIVAGVAMGVKAFLDDNT